MSNECAQFPQKFRKLPIYGLPTNVRLSAGGPLTMISVKMMWGIHSGWKYSAIGSNRNDREGSHRFRNDKWQMSAIWFNQFSIAMFGFRLTENNGFLVFVHTAIIYLWAAIVFEIVLLQWVIAIDFRGIVWMKIRQFHSIPPVHVCVWLRIEYRRLHLNIYIYLFYCIHFSSSFSALNFIFIVTVV